MNLFELFVKIGVDDQASEQVEKVGKKLGNGLKTAAKIGTAAVSMAAAAITAITTQAVNSFGEYEQLAGGAQKIFDQMDYSKIATDANNAYKELGLSANQYLAVINDVGATFAATMGDEAGYEAAKIGLKAISDYASGTGKNVDELSQKFTLITRSTSSYQSIADQFSGILPATSAGFLEQAKAAGILSDSYTQLTEVPIEEYQAAVSQMLQQGVTDLGLANNTMNEAFSTLSGSLSMAKSAWSNLVTGLADDSADLDMLIGNFVESVGAVATNLIPKIATALNGASKLVRDLIPVIVNEIPGLIEENLPILAEAAVGIVESLVDGISNNLDGLMSVIIDVVVYIANSLLKQLPKIVKLGLNLIVALAKGIAQAIPQLLPTIVEVITEIVSMISDPAMLSELLDAALEIVMALSDGLIDAIPQLLQAVSILMQGLYTFFLKPENMVKMAEAGINLIIALGAAIVESIPVLLEYWVNVITSIVDNFKNTNWSELGTSLVDSIKNGISSAWAGITKWFNGIWNSLFNNRTVSINVSKGLSGIAGPVASRFVNGSHALGLDYVPFDGYIAELHKGERVLTASEAKRYGNSVSFGNVIIQVDGRGYDEERLAVAISERLQIMTERRESVFA